MYSVHLVKSILIKQGLHTLFEYCKLILRRPSHVQVAALCYRQITPDATKYEVLLVTSRGTGRWIIPKGWVIDGKNGPQSALQEAWEEAGVDSATVLPQPLGYYSYDKILKTGLPRRVRTTVYAIHPTGMKTTFPECDQRKLKWVSPTAAAEMVDEPELKNILRNFDPQYVS